jgi:hypothetical protein
MITFRLARIAVFFLLPLALVSSGLTHSSTTTAVTPCTAPGFTTSATINLNRPRAVIVDDFNKDGKPDIGAINSGQVGPNSVALGNGDGTFSAPINTNAGRAPSVWRPQILIATETGIY